MISISHYLVGRERISEDIQLYESLCGAAGSRGDNENANRNGVDELPAEYVAQFRKYDDGANSSQQVAG